MLKTLSGWIFLGCCLTWGATLASAQCGDHVRFVIMNCGVHCGSIGIPHCMGTGTNCEDNTGEPDGGGQCCGFQFLDPGACLSAKAAPSLTLPPTPEFLALQDAVAVHKKLFSLPGSVMIASCGPDKNAFNSWLQAKLQQQHNKDKS